METAGIPNFRTQILIRGKREDEDPSILFRKIQRILWQWVGRELPGKNREGKTFSEQFPFEEWKRKRRWTFVRKRRQGTILGTAECRYLETARLMAQSVFLSVGKESGNAPGGYYDRSEDSVVAIESAKGDPDFTGVRFSFETTSSYQPFAGFFPVPDPGFGIPPFVREILSGEDWTCEFFPVITRRDQLAQAERYPLSPAPIAVGTPEEGDLFLRRFRDPLRPVCLVACFGAGRRMRRFAERLAAAAWANALVCLLDERAVRAEELDRVVPGLHARREFAAGGIRVFFPFGRYMRDAAANPGYRLPLFRTRRVESAILAGLMRYFDIDETGWRRTPRDIHMTELSLHETRREDFGKGEQGKVNALQRILSESLELRKKENAAHQEREDELEYRAMECEDRIKELEKEVAARDALLSEANAAIAEANGENARLRGKAGGPASEAKAPGPSPEGAREVPPLPRTLEETLLWAKGFLPHLVILPSAMKTAREDNGQRDVGVAWDVLRAMDSVLYNLRYGPSPAKDLKKAFGEKTRFVCVDESDDTKAIPDIRKERRIPYESRDFDFWLHVKPSSCNKEAKLIRAYFAFDDASRRILVGFFGPHMRTAATKHIH